MKVFSSNCVPSSRNDPPNRSSRKPQRIRVGGCAICIGSSRSDRYAQSMSNRSGFQLTKYMQFSQQKINQTTATPDSTEKRGWYSRWITAYMCPPRFRTLLAPNNHLPPSRSDQVHRTKPPFTNPPYLSRRLTIQMPKAFEKAEGSDESGQEV